MAFIGGPSTEGQGAVSSAPLILLLLPFASTIKETRRILLLSLTIGILRLVIFIQLEKKIVIKAFTFSEPFQPMYKWRGNPE